MLEFINPLGWKKRRVTAIEVNPRRAVANLYKPERSRATELHVPPEFPRIERRSYSLFARVVKIRRIANHEGSPSYGHRYYGPGLGLAWKAGSKTGELRGIVSGATACRKILMPLPIPLALPLAQLFDRIARLATRRKSID